MMDMLGTVVDIQHFSTHDGPGIRTTAPALRCKWCCNPETIAPKPELAYNLGQCIGEQERGRCLPACPKRHCRCLDSDGRVRVNWEMCSNCGACIELCPQKPCIPIGRR